MIGMPREMPLLMSRSARFLLDIQSILLYHRKGNMRVHATGLGKNGTSPSPLREIFMKKRWIILSSVLMVVAPDTWVQAPVLPPGEKEPLVRLEAGGPTSFVTALTFSPDGKLLYAGGWDKVVRVWSLNEQGQFVPFPATYRVPVGPGLAGAINCIAPSSDATLLAAAGRG